MTPIYQDVDAAMKLGAGYSVSHTCCVCEG